MANRFTERYDSFDNPNADPNYRYGVFEEDLNPMAAEDDVTILPIEDETENQDIFDLDGAMDDVGMTDQDVDIQALATDPNTFLTDNDLNLTDNYTELDADATGTNLDPTDDRYDLGDDLDIDNTNTVDEDDVELATEITDIPDAEGYSDNVETVEDSLDTPETTVNAAQGEITEDSNALIDASDIEIDIDAAATGVNEDGTVNQTGAALNQYATQNFSTIIDTSTTSGRLLAEELGEGNYTDAKATIAGQMEIISRQFKDPDTGEPVIPPWAQSTARMLKRSIAFDGMSGTAATAAMANAIMEATIGISKDEAAFFQTLTTENLDNRQESIINKAQALAKFEVANLGARETAAVNNADAFLQMDLKNLDLEQEAEIINTQERIDVMLSDAAETNVARRFDVEQENDFTKYYDNLNSNIQIHRSEQLNQIKRFNAGELNDGAEFEADMEDSRQKYYADMQYQIDSDNAQWRQSVAETNTELEFEAATEDVRNGLDLSQEAMNQMWDRVDSLLDHTVNNYNSEADRDANILMAGIRAQATSEAGGGMSETMTALIGLAGTALTASIYKDGVGSTASGIMDGVNSVLGAVGIGDGDGIDFIGGFEDLVGGDGDGIDFIGGAEDLIGGVVDIFTGGGDTSGVSDEAIGLLSLSNPVTATIAAVAALEALDANPFGKGEDLEIDLVDSVENVLEGDIDINPFDDGKYEVDLVDSWNNFWSDTRLKENIQHLSTVDNVNYYTWDWNAEGKKLGANVQPSFGVLAQEVLKTHPHAVTQGEDGYLKVNYGMINNEV